MTIIYPLTAAPLAGILGTQEIIILICLAIPAVLIYLAFRFLRQLRRNNRRAASNYTAAEISKLFELKEKGIITPEEFETRKLFLLNQ